MEPVQIYAIATGGIFVIMLVYSASSSISRWIQNRTLFYIFKYLVYPVFIRRHRFLSPLTRWQVVWTIVYWCLTASCNLIGVNTLTQAGSRAGSLSVVHLMPLLFAGRLSFAADLLGLSWQSYVRLHSSIGVMAFLQGFIHTLIFVTQHVFRIQDTQQFHGFLCGIALILMALLLTLKNHLYEIFQKSHYALTLLIIYAIWRHLSGNIFLGRLYLYIGVSFFVATTIARYTRLLLRNSLGGLPRAPAKVVQIKDSLRVEIKVPRPWKIRPGQYVYIWMPGVSPTSFLQSHPFMICWWDHNPEGQASNLYLLIKPKSGFTRNLALHAGSLALKCWVDGPYGKPIHTEDYGSILMFASGIGIAAQVPYIKGVLKDFGRSETRTKAILLIWQLDNENDQDWVQDWMTELLDEDKTSYILRIRLYVTRNFDDGDKSYGDSEHYGEHDSIRKFYGKPCVEQIVETEIAQKRGRLLITTSADTSMQDRVQEVANNSLDENVRVVHLDFRPRERWSFWAPRLPDVKHEGVA